MANMTKKPAAPAPTKYTKFCKVCGVRFRSRRSDARWCGQRCRTGANRAGMSKRPKVAAVPPPQPGKPAASRYNFTLADVQPGRGRQALEAWAARQVASLGWAGADAIWAAAVRRMIQLRPEVAEELIESIRYALEPWEGWAETAEPYGGPVSP